MSAKPHLFTCLSGLKRPLTRRLAALSLILLSTPLSAVCPVQSATSEAVAPLQQLKRQVQQQPARQDSSPLNYLAQFIQAPPLSQVQLSADGQWLWYWRQQGSGYWLLRSRGDGEEQVVLKQRLPFSQWLPSADNSGIWLAETDQLLFFDLRRRQLHKLWAAGQPLPGQSTRSDFSKLRVLQLERSGAGFAVMHQYQQGQHQYWQLRRHSTATLLQQHPLPLQSLWFNPQGQLRAFARLEGTEQSTTIWQNNTTGWQQSYHCQPDQFCRIRGLWQQPTQSGIWLMNTATLAQTVDRLPVGQPQTAGQQLQILTASGQRKPAADWLQAPWVADLPADPVDLLLGRNGRLVAQAHWAERLQWQGAAGWQQVLDQLQQQWPTASMSLQLSTDEQRLLVQLSYSERMGSDYWLITLANPLANTDASSIPQILQQQALALTAVPGQTTAPGSPARLWCWRNADGQPLAGYLYLPLGRTLAQSPLILYPHGGPWLQSTPVYDPVIQLLTAQGFIVLQPNYRGSSGYGPHLLRAAGDLSIAPLLDDLTSAADSLLRQDIGDPAQQMIIGHSFAGYLALQALAAEPTRWRAVVALAPPLDLAQTWQHFVPQHDNDWQLALRPLTLQLPDLGVPWRDVSWQQKMAREALTKQLTKLERPVYLWAAGLDDRTPASAIQQWASRLQSPQLQFWLDPVSAHWPDGVAQRSISRAALFYLIWHSSRSELTAAAASHGKPLPGLAAPLQQHDLSFEPIEDYLQQIRQLTQRP